MNLTELKTIDSLRNIIVQDFEELELHCENISKLIKTKVNNEREIKLKEITNYFEKNEFKVKQENYNLIATFENRTILLNDYEYGYEEMLFYQFSMKPNDRFCNCGILIKPCEEDNEIICWKNILKLQDELIIFDNYKELVRTCTSLDQLTILSNKLKENIEHYKNSMSKVKDIKYIYSFYKGESIECETFEELFKLI